MLLVNVYRNTLAIVPYRDQVSSSIDVNLDTVHGLVSLKVVSSVHQNLI